MRNSPDPAHHQQLERQMMEHFERLLSDERLRVDTTRGRRPVTTMFRAVESGDRAVELKRIMAEMGKPDRELQSKMPPGQWVEVTLSQKKFLFLREIVGKLQVICLSPVRALVAGHEPQPLGTADVQKVLTELTMANRGSHIPTTVVLVSTSGFEMEVGELAERRADRTLIFVQPNDAGGWKVSGPVETKSLVDLFDPEAEHLKRQRIRNYVKENAVDLLTTGIATDKVAAKTQLPLQVVEAELKSYAKELPGHSAKRIDGRVVLFREGVSSPAAGPSSDSLAGGADMPFFERVKALFSKKGDNEKKIAFLSERRAALSQQQDRIYDDLARLEDKESELRQQFKDSTSALTKRRLTSQLLQYRKDIERRQQMVQIISNQVNVVSTHLHNLELVKQGQGAKLPDSEEITADAVKAEEFIAQLQADTELAESVGGIATAGLSDEEQQLFEELEREAAEEKKKAALVDTMTGANTTQVKLETVETPEERAEEERAQSRADPDKEEIELSPPEPPVRASQSQRPQAEPG
jgi:hypothetical protein